MKKFNLVSIENPVAETRCCGICGRVIPTIKGGMIHNGNSLVAVFACEACSTNINSKRRMLFWLLAIFLVITFIVAFVVAGNDKKRQSYLERDRESYKPPTYEPPSVYGKPK